MDEIEKMNNGKTSSKYGDNKSAALKDLNTYLTQLMTQL
jgi:hypothetical protein